MYRGFVIQWKASTGLFPPNLSRVLLMSGSHGGRSFLSQCSKWESNLGKEALEIQEDGWNSILYVFSTTFHYYSICILVMYRGLSFNEKLILGCSHQTRVESCSGCAAREGDLSLANAARENQIWGRRRWRLRKIVEIVNLESAWGRGLITKLKSRA